tara:strand:- start:5802 stop:6401 length:600 start_codon:yes stop_codon:yes gene_type:complete
MKKLLLLLLIAPVIGNSQLLNLPVSEVIILEKEMSYTVPEGKVLQFVSSNEQADHNSNADVEVTGIPVLPNIYLTINGITSSRGEHYGNPVFAAGTEIQYTDYYSGYSTFVVFDLEAQNLAYNLPTQTTPTLYPNPTSSLLALNSNKEYDIEVYDMAGNKVMALTGNTIDMSHLSSATYIVKALDKAENEEVSYKVVKN